MRTSYADLFSATREEHPITPSTDDLAIAADGLRKSYGDVDVLAGLDLRVPRASVFALLGPNGAGKTTTVRLLATLTAPDGGRATVAGHDIVSARAAVRRVISMTGQYVALDALQTGAENLRMIGRLAGLGSAAARRRADELLERFELTAAAGRRVCTYSGGMRRRLDLAASMIRPVEVLFLDEPTTGLDPRSRIRTWELVSELRAAGTTVLLTTQQLEEADRLADSIAVIDRGRIAALGTADELKRAVAGAQLELRAVDEDALRDLSERVRRLGTAATTVEPSALLLRVPTDGSAVDVRARLQSLDPDGTLIDRFTVATASLDDVFMALTGHPSESTRECERADA